jgi:uncharacterized protein
MEMASSNGKFFFIRIIKLLFVLLVSVFITYLLFFIVRFFQVGFDVEQLGAADFVMGVGPMRILLFLQSFCLFLIPPLVLCWMYKEKATDFLSLHKPNLLPTLMGMLSILVMIPLLNVLVEWNTGLHLPDSLSKIESWMRQSENAAERVTDTLLAGTSPSDLIVNLLLLAVLAGLGEELFFRGLLQRIFTDALTPKSGSVLPNWVMHVSIWTVAFIFSAIHLQFFGFFPRLLLGAWFGYLLWWTGSIWVPMLAHFTNNALSTLTVFGQNRGILTENPDRFGLDKTWWLCLVSLVLMVSIVRYYLKRAS